MNRHLAEINESKYLTLFPTNESKGKIKNYKELPSKYRHLIISITKNSDNDDKHYLKIKFNSDEMLRIKKQQKFLA